MKTNPKYSQNGFTLVELLIALVLTLLLAGGAIMLHLSGRQASIDAEQMSRMQENIRFASDYMIRDIRNAGFRDEAFLRWGHEEQIRAQYADIRSGGASADSGDTIRIRYAGRGHCTEAFDDFRLVENEYFLNTNTGELSCRGRSIHQDQPGSTPIDDADLWGDSIGLVRGVSGLQFDKISVGGVACTFDLTAWAMDPDNTTLCTGVRVTLQLEGLQDIDNPGTSNLRTAQLTAAFRNVILDIVNYHAFNNTGS